jgi:L-lactate dehydrogenase complex protein LldF
VTDLAQPPDRFRVIARGKLGDGHVQEAIQASTARLRGHRLEAWEALEDVEAVREQAHEIRMRAVRDIDRYLAEFTQALEARGGHVKVCKTAAEACEYVVDVCRRHGAELVAKSKSMATEEIRLNDALEAAGIRPVETDLGEYILQLAGEHPVHIVAPAIEKTKEDVAELFSRVEGRPVPAELEELTRSARRQLRRVFLEADVGVTGANFAVAETGTIVTVTNEGNGRLVASLPHVHVAITGIERLVPTLADLPPLLRLLGRSGTGQRLTSYTHLVTGPRREGEEDGPRELHVVFLENGRRNLMGTKYEEMLACIRCGACLNVCPVYRQVGGHAYGWVYPGPMGSVLTPLLAHDQPEAAELAGASTLCGACMDACPVQIPLQDLLLSLRRRKAEAAGTAERAAWTAWAAAWSDARRYGATTRLATWGRMVAPLAGRLPVGRSWGAGRTMPQPAERRFRDLWRDGL